MKANEIAVIGGGPIGLYTAIRLARAGYKVDLFEKRAWPIDKVCGQGIMPSGYQCLKDIGIDFKGHQLCHIKSVSYFDKEIQFKGELKATAVGIERKVLSEKLYKLALDEVNLKLYPHTTLVNIQKENQKSLLTLENDTQFKKSYRFIFACDGGHSPTRKILGVEQKRTDQRRLGARVHFNQTPWSDGVEVYWNNGIEAYITPVGEDKLEVAFLWFEGRIKNGKDLQQELLAQFPKLRKKLQLETISSDFKAIGPITKYSSVLKSHNTFFIGDAYKFIDGITGEGISLGLKSADVIIDNFSNFSILARFKIHLIYLNYKFLVSLALVMSSWTKLRGILFSFLKLKPKIFNLILSMNDFGSRSNK